MSMSAADLKTLWRSEVADANDPPLWTDDEFYAYLDDAAKQFYRLTDGIEDSRTVNDSATVPLPLTQISVVANTDWYSISKSILKIRQAWRADTGAPLEVLFAEQLPSRGIRFDGSKNAVQCVIQGLEKHALRFWPIPNETVTVNMAVYRLPLVTITSDVEDNPPEVDDQHAMPLLLWVKHKAYDKQDEDTYDKRKSSDYKDRFEAYCAQAKREAVRARHTPGNVAYGGLVISGSRGYPNRNSNDYYNR